MVTLLSDKKQFRARWPIALILLVIASPLFAQVIPSGTISGVVKDPSGASVPNATVTALNTESNAPRTTTTGDDGTYRFWRSAVPRGVLQHPESANFGPAQNGGFLAGSLTDTVE